MATLTGEYFVCFGNVFEFFFGSSFIFLLVLIRMVL